MRLKKWSDSRNNDFFSIKNDTIRETQFQMHLAITSFTWLSLGFPSLLSDHIIHLVITALLLLLQHFLTNYEFSECVVFELFSPFSTKELGGNHTVKLEDWEASQEHYLEYVVNDVWLYSILLYMECTTYKNVLYNDTAFLSHRYFKKMCCIVPVSHVEVFE